MKVTDKVYHKISMKQGRIVETIDVNKTPCYAQVKWFDGSVSIIDMSWLELLPEQELINKIKQQPSRILKLLIEIKCWFIIFWMGKMTSKSQKWINRFLVFAISYFLIRTLIG